MCELHFPLFLQFNWILHMHINLFVLFFGSNSQTPRINKLKIRFAEQQKRQKYENTAALGNKTRGSR